MSAKRTPSFSILHSAFSIPPPFGAGAQFHPEILEKGCQQLAAFLPPDAALHLGMVVKRHGKQAAHRIHRPALPVGYGAINHPVDHDPCCGYTGIIGDTCPKCGRNEENGVGFERIRRITGYLVGTVDRFNNAKRAEERDRVKHSV